MKKYLLIATLVFSLNLSAQSNLMFDTSKIDATTKLIGRYQQYDKEKTYKALNFIIEDPATIKTVIKTLTLGKEEQNTIENPNFNLALVQNFHETKSWIINPTLNSAMYDGHTYGFDINQIKALAKKYSFDYKFENVPFKTDAEYETYLNEQKEDKSYLFVYAPRFKYEGSFAVEFPRNETFTSPKAISDYLKPLIEKIVSKDEYTVSYILNEKNKTDKTHFTMTITGCKKLYDNLQLENLKKEEWNPSVPQGKFFYKTN